MKVINLRKGKRKLAVLWFTFSIIIFIILFLQSLNGLFDSFEKESWNWFINNIIPSLSLIVSVFVLDALNLSDSEKVVERFYFRLSYVISFVYLLSMLFTLLYRPFTEYSPIEILEKSKFWLAPFQGLVTASLGFFFFKELKTKVTEDGS